MISVDSAKIFDEEDLNLFEFHPRLKLHEALQILQLDETASRDVIKEQYLKLATPVHPHHSQSESRKEFRKLSSAFYAALCTFECPHCKFFNCKECWLAKDLVYSVLKLSQDLEEEEDELERYSTDELYFFTLEKFVVDLKYCKKRKEKIPSAILSEKDEENLCVFLQLLVEKSDNIESSSEEETEENISLEQESTSIGKLEEIVEKLDCPKKKNRKAKAKVAKEPYKTKPLSKSEATELDLKRKHEIKNIRLEILKKVKLATEPKHQEAHIAVRKEVLDRDMKDEIERQRQERENHLQEVLKRRKEHAAKEKARHKKLKRSLKKNLNTSYSSYSNSSSDTSFYTSSDVYSMDSSCDMGKDWKQRSGQCIGQPEPVTRLDVVSENPLLEDRKRVVNPEQKAQVEESKKMRLNNKGELTNVNSGCDNGAILAELHQKESQKNLSEDGAMERISRRNRKSRTKEKGKKNLSNAENTPGVTYEPRTMQNSFSATTTVSGEKSPSSSYFCSSSGRDAERKFCPPVNMLSSLKNSSHVRDFYYTHEPSQPAINQMISYADIAAKSVSQLKPLPQGRPDIHKTSVQSFTCPTNDSQMSHSVTVDVSDKESAKHAVIDSVFDSFENFSLEKKSEQNEKNPEEVDSKMSSELRAEKRKSWTWLAPQDKRKQENIPAKRKESVQKKETVMSEPNHSIMLKEGASRPRRVHFESENAEILSSQRSAEDANPSCRLPNQQHISSMRDDHIKSDKNESFASEILTKTELKQILKNPLILCSWEKASSHDLQPTQHVPCRKENISTSCQENIMSVCNSEGENWNEESRDCFDSSSLSNNFKAATQSNVRFSSHGFLEHLDVDSSNKNKNKCDPSGLKDSHLEQKAFTQNALDSTEFQNKNILHPIRKPKTATQCMQIPQAKMNKCTKPLAGNTATKDPCSELFSRSSGDTGAVPNFKTAERDKSCKQYEEITNTAQRKVKPTKRLSNPSALFQNALTQVEKERNFSANGLRSIGTKSRERNTLHAASERFNFLPNHQSKR